MYSRPVWCFNESSMNRISRYHFDVHNDELNGISIEMLRWNYITGRPMSAVNSNSKFKNSSSKPLIRRWKSTN